MKINVEELQKLIKEDFEGNYKLFADEVSVNSTTVYRILTGRANPGEKFISKFMLLCKNRKYSFEKYIFLN